MKKHSESGETTDPTDPSEGVENTDPTEPSAPNVDIENPEPETPKEDKYKAEIEQMYNVIKRLFEKLSRWF